MRKYFLCFLCIFIFCAFIGCSGPSLSGKTASEDGSVLVGSRLRIQDIDKRLILQDNHDTLSADGLYYATWVMGDRIDYQNAQGDLIDLYDAQLYLLLGETKTGSSAVEKKNTWLSAARENYVISDEKERSCNGVSYSMISYSFQKKDAPYSRGISAFAVYDNCAVCIELTCRENFQDDLESILTVFLENCSYVPT